MQQGQRQFAVLQFQLHHTGIKTLRYMLIIKDDTEFQLHHTGIKTGQIDLDGDVTLPFQLHHTGIKT